MFSRRGRSFLAGITIGITITIFGYKNHIYLDRATRNVSNNNAQHVKDYAIPIIVDGGEHSTERKQYIRTTSNKSDRGEVEKKDIEEKNKENQCLPHRHIMFLKTHKCASSTVQNIVFRYGYKHNLTFALHGDNNYLGSPALFKAKMIPKKLKPPDGRVDVFAVHTRLDLEEHPKVLYNDTRWFTIIRDPVTLFESMFQYYRMEKDYGIPFSELHKKSVKNLKFAPRHDKMYGRNQILFDLGYPTTVSLAALKLILDQLDRHFDLVMIAEYMDESLILLRHLLCWNLEDMVALAKNSRRPEVKQAFGAETTEILRDLNDADVLIYDHFVAKHRQAVLEFGLDNMSKEVSELRQLRNHHYSECGIKELHGHDPSLKFKEFSGLVSTFVTNKTKDKECMMLALPEMAFLEILRDQQLKIINKI